MAAEDIIFSKIALDKSYKPILSIDDPISRQIQALFEKMEYQANKNDFWNQYYLPYFKKIYQEGKFEPFIFHLFYNVDIDAINNYKKKNKKLLEAMADDAGTYFNRLRKTRELFYSKRDTVKQTYLFNDGSLIGKGTLANNDKILTGNWIGYYSPGNLKSKGLYNETGGRTGDWIWYYFNGTLKAKEHYENGKLQGLQHYYYDNGNLSTIENYDSGQLTGKNTVYYYGGNIKTVRYYKSGKKDGEERQYYSNGSLYLINNYINDQLTGVAQEYYKNGFLKGSEQYVNGKAEGPYKLYNDAGTLTEEGQYNKGKAEGDWKYYYADGKLKQKSVYVNDVETQHEEYYKNGQPEETYSLKAKVL